MNMGDKIKQRRTELKMTQEELAEKLNVSRSSVANWEAGRNYPDLQLIADIADILELSLDELLREDCEMIKRIAEDTKCRKKQSWKIRVLSIVLVVVLVAATCFGVWQIRLKNMKTLSTQIYKAQLEIEDSYGAWSTEPAPAMCKKFEYNEYNLALHFIPKDRVQVGLESQTAEKAREDCAYAWETEEIIPMKTSSADGHAAYKIECAWDTDSDKELDFYSVVTGVDAGYGLYIIDTYGMQKSDVADVEKKHKAIVKSFELVDTFEPSPHAKDKGRVGDFIFSLPEWDTRTEREGVIVYHSQRGLSYLGKAKAIEPQEFTKENMVQQTKALYEYADRVEFVKQETPQKNRVGSAVEATFTITFDGGSKDVKVLFILNSVDKIVAGFTNEYDDKETWAGVIESIQYCDIYDEQLKTLWDGRLDKLETIDDYDKALALVSDAGFDAFGSSWGTEFADDGIIITYEEPASRKDFTREAALLLAAIEPLEYVEVVYDKKESQTIRKEDVYRPGYGNTKKIGQDKALFTLFFWETLEL